MKPLIRWCLGNRLVVVLLSLVLMAAGVAGLLRINQELLPSVHLPTVFMVVPALSGAAGASRVTVSGGARPVVTLTLDSARLRARNVTLQAVRQALSGAQVDVPAGESARAGQTVPVEVLGALRTVDDLKAL